MIAVRKSDERGHANHGWLDSHHTFSFAEYHDPAQMGFRSLRVINQDRVEPERGFGKHSHSDMEIISYVVAGKLAHRDSMGTVATLERGDVQVMSAGTGVTHSEFNGSSQEPVRFLQIWILPDRRGYAPRYEDKRFADEEKRDRLRLLASADGRDGSLPIHQDASVYASLLGKGSTLAHALAPGRHAWLQVVSGDLVLNGTPLHAGDGAAASNERSLAIEAKTDGELLLFDLA
jgi:quercetin 2,3-dioxygenase